jgi:hypothetical protein
MHQTISTLQTSLQKQEQEQLGRFNLASNQLSMLKSKVETIDDEFSKRTTAIESVL